MKKSWKISGQILAAALVLGVTSGAQANTTILTAAPITTATNQITLGLSNVGTLGGGGALASIGTLGGGGALASIGTLGGGEGPLGIPLTAAIPEPSTWAMMVLGFLALGFAFRKSGRKVSFA